MKFLRQILPGGFLLGILMAGFYLTAIPASGQEERCATSLGQVVTHTGVELSDELEILSWNIQKAGNVGWGADLASFSTDIDLAFIQEASLQARIPQAIRENMHQAFARGYSTASQKTGVMTVSSTSPSMQCNQTSWEPWLRTPKATSITEYPLLGREERLLTINLHAVNFTLGLANFQAQFEALRDVLSTHQGPVILAGDLNTWSDARQALVDNFMREHNLNPVSFEPDLRTTTFGHALDHIYTRGMRVVSAQAIPVSSSDHNALRARLAFL